MDNSRSLESRSEPGDSSAKLEAALRRAEARFEGIVGISADAIISVDEAQNVLFFNEGAEQIFGYTAGEILGRPLELLLPHRFRADHPNHVRAFGGSADRARRMGHRRQISGLRKNDEEFPAEASISKYTIDGEAVYNVVLRDITEQKRAENHQRFLAAAGALLGSSLESEQTVLEALRLAVPTLADAVAVDLLFDGVLRTVASAPADAPAEFREAVRVGTATDPKAAHPKAEALRTLSTVSTPTALFIPLVARGKPIGVLCAFSRQGIEDDVRALAEDLASRISLAIDNARLYAQAQHAIRARDETVAVVAHDLRNPVNAIKMIAANLLRSAAPLREETMRENLGLIAEAARQSDALIQDMLDVSRIEAGRLAIDAAPVDIGPIVRAAADVLGPLAAERSIELHTDTEDGPLDAIADPERVQQAVSNLVGNALKFSRPGGRVVISVARAGDAEVVIAVSDNGPGITPEQLPHVFDRYWQAGRGTRRGAGLGLPIVRGIVEAHGGRVWVESRVGEGSTFRFTLPVA